MKGLRYLCFFPSINFGLIGAEVFPYAFLYGVLSIRKLGFSAILVFSLLSISAYYTLFSTAEISEIIRSYFAYLNPLIIFIAILQMSHLHLQKFYRTAIYVFYGFCFLLAIQASGLFGFLDPFFKALVPRSSSTSMGFRGVTLLSTEPARAVVEFIFLYAVFRLTLIQSRHYFLTDLAVGFLTIVIFRSFTGIVLYVVFIFLFNRKLFFFGLPFGLLVILLAGDTKDGRAVALILQLSQMSWSEAWFELMNSSGNRLISIISSVTYGFSRPFGGGVGNWKETSILALEMTGIDYSKLNYFNTENSNGIRPYRASGYLMNLLLDVGLFGAVFITVFLYRLLVSYVRISREAWNMAVFFSFNILFVGSVGVTVPWMATAIVMRSIKDNVPRERY